jgi:formate dehydrogenase subunit gamma
VSIAVAPVDAMVPRFDRVERVVHWITATLMLTLLATGFSLYAGPLSTLVGRRNLIRTIHVYSGLLLPLPVLFAIALRAGGELRSDLGRLNRWSRDDRGWWRRGQRAAVRLGKFNPGQKLNATFIGSAMVVMLMTGSIMRWFEPFSDSWRQGATFVHDWFAIGLLFAIAGHILLAFRDPDALDGMVHGAVKSSWAKKYRPRWAEEMPAEPRETLQSAETVQSSGDGGLGNAPGDAVARAHEHGREARLGTSEVTVVDGVNGGPGDGVGEREL